MWVLWGFEEVYPMICVWNVIGCGIIDSQCILFVFIKE